MNQDDQIVLAVAGHVGNEGLARLHVIVAAGTEGALFKHLPAIARHQLVRRGKTDQIQIVPDRFQKDQVFASVMVQVAGDDIGQMPVGNGRLVAVQFGQFPNLPAQGQGSHRVDAQESQAVRAWRRPGPRAAGAKNR